MSTEFTPLTGQADDASFADTMDSVLKLLEGNKTVPYLDTQGHVTIGIGVTLADYPNSYLEERSDLTVDQQNKVVHTPSCRQEGDECVPPEPFMNLLRILLPPSKAVGFTFPTWIGLKVADPVDVFRKVGGATALLRNS